MEYFAKMLRRLETVSSLLLLGPFPDITLSMLLDLSPVNSETDDDKALAGREL